MADSNHYNEQIKQYYDSSQLLYNLFCYSPDTLGMHHGFWDETTKNRQEAIVNENQAVIDTAHVTSTDKVLDAGCGVGGTAIYIAKKVGTEVFGITLSQNQVNLADKYSRQHGVDQLTHFQVQDYTQTNFPANFFDVVYGIESICHASPKMAFLKEALRILKPGGRLVIADGYCSREPNTEREEKIIEDFTRAFELKELVTHQYMTDSLSKAGFINVRAVNKTEGVKPTVQHFYFFSRLLMPLFTLLALMPLSIFKALHRNAIATACEGQGMDIGLDAYYLHYAEKPNNQNPDATIMRWFC